MVIQYHVKLTFLLSPPLNPIHVKIKIAEVHTVRDALGLLVGYAAAYIYKKQRAALSI